MKKLLIIAILAITATVAKAQITIENYTSCEITVTTYCYNGCNVTSNVVLVGGLGTPSSPGMGTPATGSIAHCGPGEVMLINVCWYNHVSAPCYGEYIRMCAVVDGEPAPGSLFCYPFPIATQTYEEDIWACANCPTSDPLNPGKAHVKFTPPNLLQVY